MNVQHDLITDLLSIEEDATMLDKIVKDTSLENKNAVQSLLQEIIVAAISCRQKAVVLADHIKPFDTKSVVTQKEVRELLEDFA